MKTLSRSIVLIVLVLTCVAIATAQIKPKLGAYAEIAKTDAGAKAAAAFAVQEQTKTSELKQTLMSIFKVERQTVAGANYRLCLKVTSEGEGNEADVIHFVQAVVYVPPRGDKKLTSWEDSDCGEDDDN